MPRAPTARRKRSFVATSVFLLTLVAGAITNAADRETISAALIRINDYRNDNGRGTVTVDKRLTTAARRHARAMADRDFFSHVGADG